MQQNLLQTLKTSPDTPRLSKFSKLTALIPNRLSVLQPLTTSLSSSSPKDPLNPISARTLPSNEPKVGTKTQNSKHLLKGQLNIKNLHNLQIDNLIQVQYESLSSQSSTTNTYLATEPQSARFTSQDRGTKVKPVRITRIKNLSSERFIIKSQSQKREAALKGPEMSTIASPTLSSSSKFKVKPAKNVSKIFLPKRPRTQMKSLTIQPNGFGESRTTLSTQATNQPEIDTLKHFRTSSEGYEGVLFNTLYMTQESEPKFQTERDGDSKGETKLEEYITSTEGSKAPQNGETNQFPQRNRRSFSAVGSNQPRVSRILSKELEIKYGIKMDYGNRSSSSEESQIEEEDLQENNQTLNKQKQAIIDQEKLAKMKRFSKMEKFFAQRDGSNSDRLSKRQDKRGSSLYQDGFKSDRGEDRVNNQHFNHLKGFQISMVDDRYKNFLKTYKEELDTNMSQDRSIKSSWGDRGTEDNEYKPMMVWFKEGSKNRSAKVYEKYGLDVLY